MGKFNQISKKYIYAMVWMFVSLKNLHVEILMPEDGGIRWWGHWGCLGHEDRAIKNGTH